MASEIPEILYALATNWTRLQLEYLDIAAFQNFKVFLCPLTCEDFEWIFATEK